MWQIRATLLHHTNDSHCVSCDVPVEVPTFYVEAASEEEAIRTARAIILPIEMQYESATVRVSAVRVEEAEA